MAENYANIVLDILKQKQQERTQKSQDAQQASQFEQNLQLQHDKLEQDQLHFDKQLEQQTIATDIAKQMHRLQMIKSQSELAEMAQQGKIIPGATTTPAGMDKGWLQQTVSFPDNIIPSFTSLTPEAAKNKQEQQARIATDNAKHEKLDLVRGEEGIKSSFRMTENAEKEKLDQANKITLENLRQQGAMKQSQFEAGARANLEFIKKATGEAGNAAEYDYWLKGIGEGTVSMDELSKLPASSRAAILDTAKSHGMGILKQDQINRLRELQTTDVLFKRIDDSIDLRPDLTTPGFRGLRGAVASYSDPQYQSALADIDAESTKAAAALSGDKRVTETDAKKALAAVTDRSAPKSAALESRNTLLRKRKAGFESVLTGFTPEQKEIIKRNYGFYDIPDTYTPRLSSTEQSLVDKYKQNTVVH